MASSAHITLRSVTEFELNWGAGRHAGDHAFEGENAIKLVQTVPNFILPSVAPSGAFGHSLAFHMHMHTVPVLSTGTKYAY